jgi:hypothetical protein
VLLRSRSSGPGDALALSWIVDDQDQYEGYFAKAVDHRRVVEVSPSYLFNHDVSTRIHADSPNAYIIAILRNPAHRAYSQWLHLRRSLQEDLTFTEALEAEGERIKAGWSDVWRYVDSSRYAAGIKAYVDVFGIDRVHVISAEELLDRPREVMRGTFHFLDVDATVPINECHRNVGGEARSRVLARLLLTPNLGTRLGRRMLSQSRRSQIALRLTEFNTVPSEPMSASIRRTLTATFADDVRELEDLLGRRMPWSA